jgi:undecaprenyl phosphate-alpha-L-ara4N flippase subunit ArnE
MTGQIPLWTLGLLGFCVAAEIGLELNFKIASNRVQGVSPYVLALARQPALWLAITLWAMEVPAWIVVLEHAPLAIAYPLMTLTFAGVPLASALLLGEPFTRRQAAGAALVTAGILCVGLTAA